MSPGSSHHTNLPFPAMQLNLALAVHATSGQVRSLLQSFRLNLTQAGSLGARQDLSPTQMKQTIPQIYHQQPRSERCVIWR